MVIKLLVEERQGRPAPAPQAEPRLSSITDINAFGALCARATSKQELVLMILAESNLNTHLAAIGPDHPVEDVINQLHRGLFEAQRCNVNAALFKGRHPTTLRRWAEDIVNAAHDSTRPKK